MSDQKLSVRELAGYRVERELGRGGMGVVYLAQDLRLERKVALKVLAPFLADDEQFRRRFIRESQTAANLEHAHIVPVYSAGEAGGQLYIAMRYVDGRDLRRILEADGPLSLERALIVVAQVADALDAAHDEGLVHRDVKPANILVGSRGGQEHCYLCDFGVTKNTASGASLTATDQLLGTFNSIAPEQVAGRPVDRRADVYALGCVLYQCLAGDVPFPRNETAAVLHAHLHDEPPPVTALRPDVPPAVDAVVAKALAKQPEDRYESCGELALALRAAASGPVDSSEQTSVFALPGRPRPAPKVPAPPSRRRRRLVLGGAAVALVLVAATAAVGVRARGSAAPETPFPNAAERELVVQAPAAFRETCARNEIADAASVRCTSGQGAHEIMLTQFASQSVAEDAYNRQVSRAGINRDTDDCGDGYRAEHRYEGERGATGRVLCHRDNGSSVISWVSDRNGLLLLSATRPDADHAQIYKWWADLVERRLLPRPQETPAPQAVPAPHVPQIPPAPVPVPAPQTTPAPQAAAPQPRPPTFAPEVEELIAHVPASFRSTCRPSDDGIRGASAVVACGPAPGADLVKYVQFTDMRGMYGLYARQTTLRRVSGRPTCDSAPPDFREGSRYSLDGRAGRRFCYLNDEGKPQIEWTNDDLLIYSAAEGSDADALVAWWRGAGPV